MCSLSCEIKANVTLAFLEGKKRSNKDVASESRRLLADTFITKPFFFFVTAVSVRAAFLGAFVSFTLLPLSQN